jgi:hypothetical protein
VPHACRAIFFSLGLGEITMLTEEAVEKVRELLGTMAERKIAKATGVSRSSIARIRKGAWKARKPSTVDNQRPRSRSWCRGCGATVRKPCVKCQTLAVLAESGIHPREDDAELDKINMELQGSDGERYFPLSLDKLRLDPMREPLVSETEKTMDTEQPVFETLELDQSVFIEPEESEDI